MNERLPSYGGQAVIEGVMMRGSSNYAIAVRAPDQSIVVEQKPLASMYASRLARVPFLRGLLMLWDALVLGINALTFSANMQAAEDEKLEGASMTITMLISFSIGIALFVLAPAGAAQLAETALGINHWWSNFIEGLLRLGLLIGYMWAIGRMPEIKRVYGYHGAEHKTINAFEAGVELTPENVGTFPREHPRCGTAFLLTVVVFSILIYSSLGPQDLLIRLLSRLLLLPVLAALAYEYIRWSGKMMKYRWARLLVAPNLALQRLTTLEPGREMIEVSIAAFNAMLSGEQPRVA